MRYSIGWGLLAVCAACRRRSGRRGVSRSQGRPGYVRPLRRRRRTGRSRSRSCRATTPGPTARPRACSPRVPTASSCSSAASCPSSSAPRRSACATSRRASSTPCSGCRSGARRSRARRPAAPPARCRRTVSKRGRTHGGVLGVDARWEHCILVFDRDGNIVEEWTQWDSMLARPHAVYVSPYDPDKHVWIVDDFRHAIFKFTNDGKTLVQTIGTFNEPGADATHFFRPDVHGVAARRHVLRRRRLREHARREVRRERQIPHGLGRTRHAAERHAARLLQQRARHRRRSAHAARVRQRPRQQSRASLRRERQLPRSMDRSAVRRPTFTCS